jgi:hypothetical protein
MVMKKICSGGSYALFSADSLFGGGYSYSGYSQIVKLHCGHLSHRLWNSRSHTLVVFGRLDRAKTDTKWGRICGE